MTDNDTKAREGAGGMRTAPTVVRMMTREQVARVLRHQPRWVSEHLFATGLLPHQKVGRVYLVKSTDLRRYIETAHAGKGGIE